MLRVLILWIGCLWMAADPANMFGTELTFRDTDTDTTQGGFDPGISGWDISPAYGDLVSGTTQSGINDGSYVWDFTYGAAGGPTPNVSTTYNTTSSYLEHGYGDLIGAVWTLGGDLDISFEADAGFLVVLEGLDLGGFLAESPDTTVQVLDVAAGNLELYNSGPQTVAFGTLNVDMGTEHSTYGNDGAGDFFFAPLVSQHLRIIVSGMSVSDGVVGIDNIQFGQQAEAASAPVLPEPSALALHLVAGVLFLMRRFRNPIRG